MRIFTLPEVFCGLAERPRRGWVMRGVENPESTYAHSREMAEMVDEFGGHLRSRFNLCLAREMCMCHDLSDFAAEDVTPHDGVVHVRKQQIEKAGIQWMLGATLPYVTGTGAGVHGDGRGWNDGVVQSVLLWDGYEKRRWPEAYFVKQLDQLQMLRQTLRYEQEQDKCMPEMWDHVVRRVHEPCLVREIRSLMLQRPKDIVRRPVTVIRKLTQEAELAARDAGVAGVSSGMRAEIMAEREAALRLVYPLLDDVGSRIRGRLLSRGRVAGQVVLG